jgi:hypothetical protein
MTQLAAWQHDLDTRFRALIARHQPEPVLFYLADAGQTCAGCGEGWPCPDSEIIGTDKLTREEIATLLGAEPDAERVVDGLTTLQFAWGGLCDSEPADNLIHLVRSFRRAGTSTSTLCDIDRNAPGSPGFSVGGGVDGPGIVLTPCPGCVAKARAEFAGLKISGSVGSDKIRAAVAAGQDAAK